MPNFKHLIAAMLLLNVFSCDRPLENIVSNCDDFKFVDENLLEYPEKLFSAPCFNPENSNEFIYVEYEPYEEVYNKKLWKFNLLTKEKTFIADNVWCNPKYGLHEWIFFNRFNEQIWKVKSNGDSLQPLFTQELNYDVEACVSDERIVFRRIIESDYFAMFSDYDGNILYKIVDNVYSDGSWSSDGNKLLSTYSFTNTARGIAVYNTLYNLLYKFNHGEYESNDDAIHGMDWYVDSENFVWCKRDGVYRVNINSGLQELLIEGCSASEYGYPSFSPNNSTILLEHYSLKHLEGNAYFKESNIVITDINGMNEVLINLE